MPSSLVKNATYITISSILLKIVAFLYFGFIANILSPAQAGQYFIVLAIFGILAVFDDLGTTPWLIRHVASERTAKEILPKITAIKLITLPLAILLAFAAPIILDYSQEVRTLILIGVGILIADTISQTNFGVLRGERLLKYESLGVFVGQALTTISGILLLVFWSQRPEVLIVALVLGSAWNAFYSTYHVVKRVSWSAYIPSYRGLRVLLVGAGAFFLANVFTKVFSYADTFFISKLMGEHDVGIYSIAYKLTYAFQFVPLALVAALYPALSYAIADDAKSRMLVEGALKYLALIVFPIVGGIYAIAPELIAAYASPEYQSALYPLRILIFSLVFTFLDFPVGALLNARMRQNTKTGIMGATLVLNVILNAVLIPLYGLVGASIAALVSFVFMFGAGWVMLQGVLRVHLWSLLRIVSVPALGAFLMAFTVLQANMNLYLSIALGALVYITVIFGTRYISLHELRSGWRESI